MRETETNRRSSPRGISAVMGWEGAHWWESESIPSDEGQLLGDSGIPTETLCGKQPGKKGEAGSRLRERPCKVRRTLCSRRCEPTLGSFTVPWKEGCWLAESGRLTVSASQSRSLWAQAGALENSTQRRVQPGLCFRNISLITLRGSGSGSR